MRLAPPALALLVAACGDTGSHHRGALRLDLSACTVPADAEGCWDGLLERHDKDIPACLALRGAAGDLTLPLWLHRQTGVSSVARGTDVLTLPGPGEHLAVKLFYLATSAGDPGELCVPESFDVDRACRPEGGCLLATAAAEVDVTSSGRVDLAWGRGGPACAFECGDATLCGAADGERAAEVCDGRDNDCDGRVDEDPLPAEVALPCGAGAAGVCARGAPRCTGGTWTCVQPADHEDDETRCDGRDNDCDGATDEGLGVGAVCSAGRGACRSDGRVVCADDGGLRCDAVPGPPSSEACNGADDDCDGATDEGCNGCPADTALPEGWSCVPPPDAAFAMGSPPDERGRDDDEARHPVSLSHTLLVSQTEVTQRQWAAVLGEDPAYFLNCGRDCPVERVSWFDALAWLNLRSEAEGLTPCYALQGCTEGGPGGGCEGSSVSCEGDYRCDGVTFAGPAGCDGYRLPTEAEWEWLARAGTETAYYTGGPGADAGCGPLDGLDGAGWYCGNADGITHPGAALGALPDVCNAWWVCDLLGNVHEWVWDVYRPDYGGLGAPEAPIADPVGPPHGEFRVLRGGSWRSEAPGLRAADRVAAGPGTRRSYLGFRAVRTVLRSPDDQE